MSVAADDQKTVGAPLTHGLATQKPFSSWSVFCDTAFQQPRAWARVAGLSIVSAGLALLSPWPVKLIVDNVIGDKPLGERSQNLVDALPFSGDHALLVFLALASVLLVFGHAVIDASLTMRSVRLSQGMVFELGSRLFAQLQRRSLTVHARTPVGDSVSRITGDTWAVDQLANRALIGPFQTLLIVVGAAWALKGLDPQLTLAVLLIAPIAVAASLTLGGSVRRTATDKRVTQATLQSHVQQMLSAAPIIQGFAQERRFSARFRAIANESVRIERRGVVLSGLNELASGFASACGLALVLWLAAGKTASGAMTVGSLLVFIAYMQIIQTQLKSFAGVFGAVQTARAGLDRVTDVLNEAPEIADIPGAPDIDPKGGAVHLDRVSVGYERNTPVLHEVSLALDPGEIVAVIGPSGAGKTTLASLLPRFLDPYAGVVRLGGTDVRQASLRSVRRAVAVVPQDPVLMPVSIAENIAYGKPDATRDAIAEAARLAAADGFIDQLPEGYETIVGERGATLSGGQRQRIAIARALLTDAPVLVFDEPTSALDSGTERALVEALDAMRGQRTMLIIAHRMTTAAVADRVVVLRDGRIAGEGPPERMLASARMIGDADWVESATP
ncbi:MAG TPA: ABC transporter ATP-binding protein [Thermomicrobiales bacterium]|nr:ABC transporter ATP-binding protein [Thermomicrobiales bacterium]